MISNKFSVKNYLIENKLADEKGHLIESDHHPLTGRFIGPYPDDEAMIYLCSVIYFLNNKEELSSVNFSLIKSNDFYFTIVINQYDIPSQLELNVIISTLDFLIPNMAGSNVSYLSGNLFFDE